MSWTILSAHAQERVTNYEGPKAVEPMDEISRRRQFADSAWALTWELRVCPGRAGYTEAMDIAEAAEKAWYAATRRANR